MQINHLLNDLSLDNPNNEVIEEIRNNEIDGKKEKIQTIEEKPSIKADIVIKEV